MTTCDDTGLGIHPTRSHLITGSMRSTGPGMAHDLWLARKEAHRHLDEFWNRKPFDLRGKARVGVYAWLRRMTGLSKEECHIAKFDRGMCDAVILLCQQAKAGVIEKPRLTNGNKRWNHDKR